MASFFLWRVLKGSAICYNLYTTRYRYIIKKDFHFYPSRDSKYITRILENLIPLVY
jgi:hypothetical protein